MNKKLLLPLFTLIAAAQLYVPAKMILDREDILATGKEYKFRTAPVDPNDPFRGKYITLRYKENIIKVQNARDWTGGEPVYVVLTTGTDGFARPYTASKEKPKTTRDFIKGKVISVDYDKKNLQIEYPFDRYYMEEFKAYNAEKEYARSLRDTNKVTYGLVKIKDGEAVLTDVLVEGISIREIVKAKK